MISSKIAEELKDSGFPQNGVGQMMHDHTVTPPRHYYLPPLEELIAACGDGFENLCRDTSVEGEIGWLCNNYVPEGEVRDFKWIDGKSPEEALARLWLSLHANGDATA
jgi:hypothetical protein